VTRAQEKLGRRLARAIRGLEFAAQLTDKKPLEVDLVESGLGRTPRVEVRHPDVERGGFLWLVALVVLEPEPEVTYAVSVYRDAIERAVRRVLAVRSVA
jgi:hypothetical protein